MSEVVWIRITIQRLSRVTHRVSLRTGAVACGIGRASLEDFTPGTLRDFETKDKKTPRCPKCEKVAA